MVMTAEETKPAKKQLVRAVVTLEVPIDDKTDVFTAGEYLREALRTVTAGGAAFVTGHLELVKVSETGKQSRTKLGDVK